jgi:sporulation protein YlmC with PRC-barrel domain
MTEGAGTIRAGAMIGRPAYDRDGNRLGTIADLIVDGDLQNGLRVTHAVVARRPWGRLLGYEREQATGPWLIRKFARIVMHRRVRVIDWNDLDHSR